MRNKRTHTLKSLCKSLVVVLVVTLTGCGVPGNNPQPVGLDSIAPDSRSVTIVERGAHWYLSILDLQNGSLTRLSLLDPQSGSLTRELNKPPESSFSLDGRYLLIHTDDWLIENTVTGQQEPVAGPNEHVEFLPNGYLLIQFIENNMLQFYSVDPAHPQSRSLQAERIRYVFTANSRGCPRSLFPERALWLLVNADDAVLFLDATRTGITLTALPVAQSLRLITLLDRQLIAAQGMLIQGDTLRTIETKIKADAANAGEALTDEELTARVNEQITENTYSFIRGLDSAAAGKLSPDGTKLLFLGIEFTGRSFNFTQLLDSAQSHVDGILFSLYLINLTTGAEKKLTLETDWLPSFAFSPDGQQILFESDQDGDRALYLANADGTETRRITDQGALNLCWYLEPG